MIFYDTETCGLCGPVVLIQWARDDGEVHLYSVWHEPIYRTIELIEMFMDEGVCGFNLVFDHYQLCKIYTMFAAWHDHNDYPIDIIDELAMLEPKAMSGQCLKPRHALDLMLHARKGPYQSTMDREDIRIKRVPTVLAYSLAEELNKRIPLNPIYFARNKNNTQWHVLDTKVDDNTIDQEAPEFRDIILKFAPSSALKALAVDIGLVNKEEVMFFHDIDVDSHWLPVEYGFAPYALAGTFNERGDWLATYPGKWRGTYPDVIEHHISHWTFNERARKYAELDVVYTRKLYKHFGCPAGDDDDSVLACMVGAVRWHGLKLDVPQIKKLRDDVEKIATSLPFVNSPEKVLYYIKEPMDEVESAFITSTKKIVLEEIAKWEAADPTGPGTLATLPHPSALRAQEVLKCRTASKEVELYDKLIQAGRFFPSFKIIGTLSTRMSGSDGLNPQGIKRDKRVRMCFPLNHDPENFDLNGGDYDSFEVVLADAEYNDPELRKALLNGKKIHAIFGQYVFIPKTYDEILNDKELYTRSKNAVFAMLYGGEAETLKDRLGVDIEVANEAYRRFTSTYVEVGKARVKVFNMFCVTGDTWIMTNDGAQQAYELVNKVTDITVNSLHTHTAGFFSTGKKKVYEVTTNEGYKVQVTEDQPFLVNYFSNLSKKDEGIDYWIPMDRLKLGDSVRLNHHNNLEWDTYGSNMDGYILGWLFGDGSIASQQRDNRLYFYEDDFYAVNMFEELLHTKATYISESNCFYISSPKLDNLIMQYGIDKDKQINTCIEKASSEFYKGFISAFIDTDGSVRSDAKQVSLSQSDLPRLEAVQRMLLRLGIVSSIKPALKKGKGKIQGRIVNIQNSYTLNFYKENCITFQNRIRLMNPIKRSNLELAILKCDKRKEYKEYFTTKIVSIKYIGIKETYDVTVPRVESFSGNGFILHNCSMRQPNGIGTKVEWHEPADYIESLFGFKRYFTLENKICKALFELAQDPPKAWKTMQIRVVRRDREQTVSGACQSALFASAFAIQAAAMRAACNHRIQSSGAQITKKLQRNIWDVQPVGASNWMVLPINIHDEVLCVTHKSVTEKVRNIVNATNESYRPRVPLIKMEWKEKMKSWAEK